MQLAQESLQVRPARSILEMLQLSQLNLVHTAVVSRLTFDKLLRYDTYQRCQPASRTDSESCAWIFCCVNNIGSHGWKWENLGPR